MTDRIKIAQQYVADSNIIKEALEEGGVLTGYITIVMIEDKDGDVLSLTNMASEEYYQLVGPVAIAQDTVIQKFKNDSAAGDEE